MGVLRGVALPGAFAAGLDGALLTGLAATLGAGLLTIAGMGLAAGRVFLVESATARLFKLMDYLKNVRDRFAFFQQLLEWSYF